MFRKQRLKRWWVLLIVIPLLSGCGVTFTYRHIDWLAFWYLDDYVEFTPPQKEQVKIHIRQFINWHWHHELPRYQRQLLALQQGVKSGPMTQQQWLMWMNVGQQDWQVAKRRLAHHLQLLSGLFTRQQIDQLFTHLEKQNQQTQERHQRGGADKQKERRFTRLLSSLEDWTGKLSQSQRQLIQQWLKNTPSTFDQWMKHRRQWQQQLHQCLLTRKQSDFPQRFMAFFQSPEKQRADSAISVAQQNRIRYAQLLADLDQSLSAKQRRHLVREIDSWRLDVADLIADGAPQN